MGIAWLMITWSVEPGASLNVVEVCVTAS